MFSFHSILFVATFEIPLLGITSTVEPSCSHNSQSTLNLSEEDYAINLIEDIKTPQYPKVAFFVCCFY